MIALKLEGTDIGIEETVLRDVIMEFMPSFVHEMAEKDIKMKTVYLGVKGVSMMMLTMIRREAVKNNFKLDIPEEEDPVISLLRLLLNGATEFIKGQSADAIYHIEGDKIVVTGIKLSDGKVLAIEGAGV